jgi:hypothetical protein
MGSCSTQNHIGHSHSGWWAGLPEVANDCSNNLNKSQLVAQLAFFGIVNFLGSQGSKRWAPEALSIALRDVTRTHCDDAAMVVIRKGSEQLRAVGHIAMSVPHHCLIGEISWITAGVRE